MPPRRARTKTKTKPEPLPLLHPLYAVESLRSSRGLDAAHSRLEDPAYTRSELEHLCNHPSMLAAVISGLYTPRARDSI